MRRLSLLTAFFALFLFVAQLGLWVGEVAQRNGPKIAFQPVEARAPVRAAPAEHPPRPVRTFANVLPYAPAVALAEPGAFELIDTEGRIADKRDLAGRYSLVFFGYTHCGIFCAATLDALSFALVQLGAAGDEVSVLFITVDPARDTQKALADYVSPLHENVRALTGTDEQIGAALAAFGARRVVNAADANGHYTVAHPGVVLLLNRQGRFVGTFPEAMPGWEIAQVLRGAW